MSVQAMTWAWEQNLDPSDKLVLLALANRTNHETGICFPGQKLLAQECSMSDRSVRRHLKNLEALGLLERRARMRDEGRGRTSDEYRIAYFHPDILSARSRASGHDDTTNRTTLHDQPDTGVQTRTERETKEETLAAAPREIVKRERQADPLWDTMLQVCAINKETLTGSERGRINKALKELREVRATPDELRARAKAYTTKYPGAALTPTALSANWSQLQPARTPRTNTCQLCAQPFDAHDEDVCLAFQGRL